MYRGQTTRTDIQNRSILAAWQQEVLKLAHNPALQGQIEQFYNSSLFLRFAQHYRRLHALPRHMRRAMRRRMAKPLATLALVLALGDMPAFGAIINVGGACNLVKAITAANTDTATGGCTAGSGADTIVLASGSTHTLMVVNNTTYGANGLPVISSEITIDGNGSTIERGSITGTARFRILAVGSGGNLTLQETTITGGNGGGVYNRGTLTMTDSAISGNSTSGFNAEGGGVFNNSGGMFNNRGTLTMTNSTISGNSTSSSNAEGGGVFNLGYDSLFLRRTLVSGNTSIANGPEIFNDLYSGSTVTVDDFNLFGSDGNPGVYGFIPGATDIIPAPGVVVSEILNPALANNGGSTRTHTLVSGSPAIDAVTTGCPPPAKDQRGATRPFDGNGDGTARCDIGALELITCFGLPTTIVGTAENNIITGTNAVDVINGLGGNDNIDGRGGNDTICGGTGNDRISGGTGRDRLLGEAGGIRSMGEMVMTGSLGEAVLTR